MKAIVTTTIHEPTTALMKFVEIAQHQDWVLIIAGDLKTPHESYRALEGLQVVYLHPDEQRIRWPELSELVGWNCIQRRNFGFLYAHSIGAEIIATVDDDNIPMDGWGKNLLIGDKLVQTRYYTTSRPVFDPLYATNYTHLWHRGFPIQEVSKRNGDYASQVVEPFHIQADFWNGDPDVDAICRMQFAPDCIFGDYSFPFTANKISPFNSQNTFISKEVLPHYFMFPQVGRLDDILASYHAQAHGFKVIYGKPSITQKRNDHDLTEDMKAEYFGYENIHMIIDRLSKDKDAVLDFVPDRSRKAFYLYQSYFQ